jgi:non-heme chloroperoxidase
MKHRVRVAASALLLFFLTAGASAQQPASWHDPSPHTVQFIAVDKDVKLEVLDWGGSGHPLVLLTGLGNTAHVFDDFALQLTPQYPVYGITRRGYGTSSAPAPDKDTYSADRLGDDVLAVLDALKLDRPVLVGHSIAGEELSSIGSRHPERVAALIYLDAAYEAAYVTAGANNLTFDLADLQKKLEELKAERPLAEQRQLTQQLLQNTLPGFEKDLQGLLQGFDAAPAEPKSAPQQTAGDLASFAALSSWMVRVQGYSAPEAELRQQWEARPDGGVGKHFSYRAANSAIAAGQQRYSAIHAPVLAIFANPHKPGPYPYNTPAERAAAEAWEAAGVDAIAKAFQAGVPSARVVQIPQSNHYVFISNEADVLLEIHAFLTGLP